MKPISTYADYNGRSLLYHLQETFSLQFVTIVVQKGSFLLDKFNGLISRVTEADLIKYVVGRCEAYQNSERSQDYHDTWEYTHCNENRTLPICVHYACIWFLSCGIMFCVGDISHTNLLDVIIWSSLLIVGRSQWPRGLRRESADARKVGFRVRIRPGARMSVSCECCVLSGRGLSIVADHWSRGVLPSVVCLSVIVNPR
jgi:hypothetical protein